MKRCYPSTTIEDPVDSRNTTCAWEGEKMVSSIGAENIYPVSCLRYYNILNPNSGYVGLFEQMKNGANFYNVKGIKIELCKLRFRAWIQRALLPVIPTPLGTTARVIIAYLATEKHSANYEDNFIATDSQGDSESPVFAPRSMNVEGVVEVLYDQFVRLSPEILATPTLEKEEFIVDANAPVIKLDVMIDLEGRESVFRRVAGDDINVRLGKLVLWVVSNDPNLQIEPTWNMHYSCDLYFNDK